MATVNRAKSKGNIQVRQNLVDLDLYNNEKVEMVIDKCLFKQAPGFCHDDSLKIVPRR